jgi:hypothetical protein
MPGLLGWLAATFRGRTVPLAQTAAPRPAAVNGQVRTFLLGVAGGDYANSDGTSRQRIMKGCRVGEPMVLVCEPLNPYDYRAVAVRRRATAERIGYLPRGHGLTRLVEQHRVAASIAAVSGGTWSTPSRKVVLQITVFAKAPKAETNSLGDQMALGRLTLGEPDPLTEEGDNGAAGRTLTEPPQAQRRPHK